MGVENVIGVRLSGDAEGLKRALDQGSGYIEGFATKARGSMRGVGAETDRLSGGVDALAQGMKSAFIGSSVAVGLITLKNMVADVGRELIATQIASDKMRNGLNFAVGSANAGREMAFITQSAQKLGLELVSAGGQYTKLAAAARGTTLEGQATRDVFTSIAQASTVMGLSAEQTEGALLAVTQMISKGKVQAEELRGQLGERLPGAFQIAARAMGVTTGELDKMLETGKVMADDFLPKFARQLSQETAPQVEAASQSMQASMNRLENAWTSLKRGINEGGAGKALQNEVQGVSNYVQSVSDAMDRARKNGSGSVMQLSAALGEIIARAPFDVLSLASNTLNGSLNFLSLGALKLNTNLNLLPTALDTNARRAEAMAAALPGAVAEMGRLEKQLAKVPDNIYLKSEIYQLQLFIQKAKEAKAEQDKLRGVAAEDPTTAGVRASGIAREKYMRDQKELSADLVAIEQKLSGVDKDYLPTLDKLQAARESSLVTEQRYIELVTELAKKNYNKPHAEKQATAYDRLSSAIGKNLDLANEELASGGKLSAADKMRRDDLRQITDEYVKGGINAQQWIDLTAKANTAADRRELADATTAQGKFMESIREKIAVQELDLQQTAALTEGQKLAAKFVNELADGTLSLSEADKIARTAALESLIAIEKANASSKESEKLRASELKTLQESTDTMLKKAMGIEDEIALYGMSQEAIKELTIARLQDQLAEQMSYGDTAMVDAINARIAATKRLAKAQDGLKFKDDSAKATFDTWKRGWEETDRLARDAFTGWAENGTSMAEAIGKSLKKALLSAIYEATIRPIAFQLYTSIAGGQPSAAGGNGVASSLTSGLTSGNFLSGIGKAADNFNGAGMGSFAVSSMGQNLGLSSMAGDGMGPPAMSAAGEAFSALPVGGMITAYSKGGMEGFASGIASTAAAGAISGLIAGTGAMAGASGALMAMGPYGWAALAVMAVLGANKGEYVKSTGSSVQYFDKTGAATSTSALANNFNTPEADAYTKGIRDAYTNAAKTLGVTNAGGLFASAFNNSDGGKFGVQVGVGTANYSTGELKTTDEAMALEASRAVFAALQGSELPKYLAGVFDGLTASTATADQISAAIAYAQNIKVLHDQFEQLPFQNLRDLSLEATKGLIDFAGGLDKLGANLQGYYQNYYTEEEQRAQTITNIVATLNAAGASLTTADVAGATRETFRALVEGVKNIETEAGQKTYAALLSVQGAFADVTKETKAATSALSAQTDAQRDLQAAWSAEGARLDALYKDQADKLLAAQTTVQELRDEATQKYLDAQNRVTEAQRSLADVLHSTIKGFQDVLGGMDAGATPLAKLSTARKNFDDLTARARAGDTAAIGQLAASGRTLLDLSDKYSATLTEYRADDAKVRTVLNEGIAAGKVQLEKLPVEMQQATDPLKAAYDALTKATADEQTARVLAIAMQASLTSSEKSLGDKYLAAISALPDEKALKEFYKNTLQAAADAAAVAAAAAAAAAAILARMTGGTTAVTPGFVGPLPGTQPTVTPDPTRDYKPDVPKTDGSMTVIDLNPGTTAAKPGTYTPGLVGGGTYTGTNGASMIGNDLIRTDGANGTNLFWARDVAAGLNEYAAANGSAAATARAYELGASTAMLEQIRAASVGLPQFAVGTNYVPRDMTARIHRGEAIIPAAFNPVAFNKSAGSDGLLQAVRALDARIAALLGPAENTAKYIQHLDDITDKVTRGGRATLTEAFV